MALETSGAYANICLTVIAGCLVYSVTTHDSKPRSVEIVKISSNVGNSIPVIIDGLSSTLRNGLPIKVWEEENSYMKSMLGLMDHTTPAAIPVKVVGFERPTGEKWDDVHVKVRRSVYP